MQQQQNDKLAECMQADERLKCLHIDKKVLKHSQSVTVQIFCCTRKLNSVVSSSSSIVYHADIGYINHRLHQHLSTCYLQRIITYVYKQTYTD